MKKENEKTIYDGKYTSLVQLPDDILYEDFRFYHKDKKNFCIKGSDREVHPLPIENGHVK